MGVIEAWGNFCSNLTILILEIDLGRVLHREDCDASLTPIQNDACTLCHACSSLASSNTMHKNLQAFICVATHCFCHKNMIFEPCYASFGQNEGSTLSSN